MPSKVIYEDETGFITGYLRKDGYWWIDKFVINETFRGRGLAKKLAAYLPFRCMLLAQPLMNMRGDKLPKDLLVKFYLSIRFTECLDKYDNVIVTRG